MSRMDVMCKFAFDVANDDSHGYTQGAGRMGPTDYDCAGLCITAAKKAARHSGVFSMYTATHGPHGLRLRGPLHHRGEEGRIPDRRRDVHG